MNSTHTTRITIGNKPMEAIAAEYAADFQPTVWTARPPDDRPGWIESAQLRKRTKLSVYSFKARCTQLVAAGLYEMGFGTKVGSNGKPCRSVYYRKIS